MATSQVPYSYTSLVQELEEAEGEDDAASSSPLTLSILLIYLKLNLKSVNCPRSSQGLTKSFVAGITVL